MFTYIICAWVGKPYMSTCIRHIYACVYTYDEHTYLPTYVQYIRMYLSVGCIHTCLCTYKHTCNTIHTYVFIGWVYACIICMKTILIDLDAIMIMCLQKLEPHWGFGNFDTLWDVDKDKVAIPYLVVVASWFKTLRWCSERIFPICYLTLRKKWPCVRNRPKLKQRRITTVNKPSSVIYIRAYIYT